MSKKYLSLDEAASMLGVPREELTRLADPLVRDAAIDAVRASGFGRVTIDPDGFRSGKLNDAIVGRDRLP